MARLLPRVAPGPLNMKTIHCNQLALLLPKSSRARVASTFLLALLLLLLSTTASVAQCDMDLRLTSSKTEYLDAQGTLQRTVEEQSTVEITRTGVTITPPSDPQMKGIIKSHDCKWKVPFKEGKSIIKATFTDEQKGTLNATITIEGKDGVVTLLMEAVEMPTERSGCPSTSSKRRAEKSKPGKSMNDLRFAVRQLLKNPGFTAVAVLALACGRRWSSPDGLTNQSEPLLDHDLDFRHLRLREGARSSKKLGGGNGEHSLDVEHTRRQEGNVQFNLKLRPAFLSRVGDSLDQRAIPIREWDANHEHWADFGSEAKVSEPHLASLRTAHGLVPPGPSGQTLPLQPKLGLLRSRFRKHRHRERRLCARETAGGAPRPIPADLRLSTRTKPPEFRSLCSRCKATSCPERRQARLDPVCGPWTAPRTLWQPSSTFYERP